MFQMKKPNNLLKCFPEWYDPEIGGIFKTLYEEYSESFEWLEHYTDLDLEYFGNRSGDKTISPILDKFISQNRENQSLHPEKLTDQQRQALAHMIANKYGVKWTKLYALLSAEYNPIENYSMTETETPDISRKHRVSNDFEEKNERKTKTDMSRTDIPTEDYEVTDEKKTKSDFSVETETDGSSSGYGFNSSGAVPVAATEGNSTVTTTGDADDNVETTKHTQVGSIRIRETGDADDNVVTDRHTQTGYTEETETGTRELTRAGNIGVTTSQQMIESEIQLWEWNFFETVFADVDSVLTIKIYSVKPVFEPIRNLIRKLFTRNGTYRAADYGADGFSIIDIEVEPNLLDVTFTANGEYHPSDYEADGFGDVNVEVPAPTLITKSITENGTYPASADNADGYSSVTVNVPGEEVFYRNSDGQAYPKNVVIPATVTGTYLNADYMGMVYLIESIKCLSQTMTAYMRNFASGTYFGHFEFPYITSYSQDLFVFMSPNAHGDKVGIIGSIGHPVTLMRNNLFGGGDGWGGSWSLTIYVDATTIADIPTEVTQYSPWGAGSLTNIIYRNSTTGEVITA